MRSSNLNRRLKHIEALLEPQHIDPITITISIIDTTGKEIRTLSIADRRVSEKRLGSDESATIK